MLEYKFAVCMEFSTYIENFCVNAALEVFMKEHNSCGFFETGWNQKHGFDRNEFHMAKLTYQEQFN